MRKARTFICDLETTVYEGQTFTEAWASAVVEIGASADDVLIFHSLAETWDFFLSLKSNLILYYHNLKFDGSFWLDFFLNQIKYTQAYEKTGDDETDIAWIEDKYMSSKTFKYSITELGQWYSIKVKVGKYFIEFRDSLKLLPFSVEKIGKAFETEHKKLTMDYTGIRWAGCEITEEERKYIANDVLVMKEAMELMLQEGHDKLTIGACCLGEYKKICAANQLQVPHFITEIYDKPLKNPYYAMFPDMYKEELDKEFYGSSNADEYIRKAYHGGYCYVVPGKANKVLTNGTTGDVNSEYPFEMHSSSGSGYPIGHPNWWRGNFIPEDATGEGKYYYVRIKTRFYLKPGYLPFIQIKGNLLYDSTECLKTSDVYDSKNDKYFTHWTDSAGVKHDTRVELTLTCTDFVRIKEFYDLVDFEILDGCWFRTTSGLFDSYIDKYMEIKKNSEGAKRQLAKLFLNNLYGKFAASIDSSFKVAYTKDDGVIGFIGVTDAEKTPGYIPIGAAITSYARDYVIRAAQANYHGDDKPGFVYADTDSIHCDLPPEEIKGIKVDDKELGCWKLESTWDYGYFARQKTYVEHVVSENLQSCEPHYTIRCAGMPPRCKYLFELSMSGTADPEGYEGRDGSWKKWTEQEYKFLFDENGKPIIRTIKDFSKGLSVPGALKAKRIRGGIILQDDCYTMN